MRIKTILSLIAFVATFVLSVSLIGLPKDNFYSRLALLSQSQQNRQNIRMILLQDINNGRFRDSMISQNRSSSESYDLEVYADATEDYINASQSMDDSNLPADFQEAFRANMNAWRAHSDFLNRLKESAKDGSPMSDNPFMLSDSDARTYQRQVDEINSTWYRALRIGRKYNVYVPVQ